MGTQQDPRITKLGYTMSFHKQIERQLAQEFSPNEATILVDYNDAVYYGRRLQALEMGRIIGIAVRAVLSGLGRLFQIGRQTPRISTNDHLRRDIGLDPVNSATTRGYL
jgi:hypothetical protein